MRRSDVPVSLRQNGFFVSELDDGLRCNRLCFHRAALQGQAQVRVNHALVPGACFFRVERNVRRGHDLVQQHPADLGSNVRDFFAEVIKVNDGRMSCVDFQSQVLRQFGGLAGQLAAAL